MHHHIISGDEGSAESIWRSYDAIILFKMQLFCESTDFIRLAGQLKFLITCKVVE